MQKATHSSLNALSGIEKIEQRINHLNQLLTREKRRKYRIMNSLELSSIEMRRKRTRSLIQIGSLADKAGLLETFSLPLGADFQKDPDVKNNIAALFKGFLVLNEMAQSEEEVNMSLWAQQGVEVLVRKEGKI